MPDGPTLTPVSPDGLAELAVAGVLEHLHRAREAGVAVRLAVDGAVEAETRALADLVAARALAVGVPAVRVGAVDFQHRRSVRLEWGPADVDNAYERWLDWAALQREVLDPLADPTTLTWLPRLWDVDADRAAREALRTATPGTLAVVDGPYLLRWELTGSLDAAVHLLTSEAALLRRFPEPDDPRPGAWQRYLVDCDPAARADLVVRYDHPQRPAVLGRPTPG